MFCDYNDFCRDEAVAMVKVSVKRGNIQCCEYHAKEAISVRNSNIRTFKEDVARKKERLRRWNDPARWFMSPGHCHRLKEDHPNWEELMVTEAPTKHERLLALRAQLQK